MWKRFPAFVGVGVAASVVAALLGYAEKLPCSSGGAWNSFTGQFRDSCYTDIYPLYYTEGLSSGKVPYYGHPVEYPVLMGWMMEAAAWAVHSVADAYARGKDFYEVTVLMLAVCLIVGVVATAAAANREGNGAGWKTALMVAFSPALILAAYINWDLFAMALTACGLAAWAARRPWLAGVMLGLAVATKFYPLMFFGALFLLCLRAGKLREFGKALAGGLIAWLVINVPVALTATSGWAEFYAFSRDRGADWGSVWYLFENYHVPVVGNSSLGQLNFISSGSFAVACVLIAVLALAAPRRPRLPQLCFLLLAAFLILNKVWSPQYVIWLVPLARARPAPDLGLCPVAIRRGVLLPRHLGLLRLPVPAAKRHQHRLVLRHTGRPAGHARPGRVDGRGGHPAAGTGPGAGVRRQRRPGGRRPRRCA